MNERKDMTVAELFGLWFEENRESIGETARRLYSFYYSQYVSKVFDGRRVKDLTADEWAEFENKLETERNTSREYISPAKLKQAIDMSHKVFEFGARRYGLPAPVHIEESEPKAKVENEMEFFSRSDVMNMAAAVQPFDIYHLCIMLGVLTGITYPEMCGLQWQDVDPENRLIHIRRLGLAGVTHEGYIADCKIVPLKYERDRRDLPVHGWIMQQLCIMKDSHDGEQLLLMEPFEDVKPIKFRDRYIVFLKKAGVEYKPISAMRNTFAVHSFEDGMEPEKLKELLGTLDVYGNIQTMLKAEKKRRRYGK